MQVQILQKYVDFERFQQGHFNMILVYLASVTYLPH